MQSSSSSKLLLLRQSILRRQLSSSSSLLLSQEEKNSKISKALYRQLLRWCNSSNKRIPLSNIPPVTFLPPKYIDAKSLYQLSKKEERERTLPSNWIVEDTKLVAPICYPSDVKLLVQTAFRLSNNSTTDTTDSTEVVKDRIGLAFDALKSLNELNVLLDQRRAARNVNLKLSTDIIVHSDEKHFLVGQVVQHKLERYRAIVIGYSPNNTTSSSTSSAISDKPTSLTQKNYSSTSTSDKHDTTTTSTIKPLEQIQYKLLLDSGDAHLLGQGHSANPNSFDTYPIATHEELELVTDPCLCRIRNHWTSSNFTKFNIHTNQFEPNHILRYEHPTIDDDDDDNHYHASDSDQKDNNIKKMNDTTKIISQDVITGIQQIAQTLNEHVIQATTKLSKPSTLLSTLQDKLSSIAKGNIVSPEEQMEVAPYFENDDDGTLSKAIQHIKAFLHFTLHHTSLLTKRSSSLQHIQSILYPLGTIIRHSKYNYRGVIVAWDGTPQTDVRNWDGLKDVKNVMDKPFYHVIPDLSDCRKVFGGERSFRYVCQDNITEWEQRDGQKLDVVDLDPTEWTFAEEGGKYEPTEELKFKFAESLGPDEDIIVTCMEQVMSDITSLQLLILENDSSQRSNYRDNNNNTFQDMSIKLSMSNLLHLLHHAESLDDGIIIEETIKELWKVHPNATLRHKLDEGITHLLNGNTRDALEIFSSLVNEEGGGDETYFEAWNKKSTCHYMLGENEKSMEAAQKVLQYQPKHFQARNGIGLIHHEDGNYDLAVEAFREALACDPWSPVSTRLSSCLDLVDMEKKKNEKDNGAVGADVEEEEEGAAEGSAPYERNK